VVFKMVFLIKEYVRLQSGHLNFHKSKTFLLSVLMNWKPCERVFGAWTRCLWHTRWWTQWRHVAECAPSYIKVSQYWILLSFGVYHHVVWYINRPSDVSEGLLCSGFRNSVSRWFFIRLWSWGLNLYPKCRYVITRPHGGTTQHADVFVFMAVRTAASNLFDPVFMPDG